nr:MAG TPA: hypothetical protein [Caudoviricetes sp.]
MRTADKLRRTPIYALSQGRGNRIGCGTEARLLPRLRFSSCPAVQR